MSLRMRFVRSWGRLDMKFDESSLYNIKSDFDGTRRSLFDLAIWKNGLAFKKIDFSATGLPVIKIAELNNGINSNTSFTQGDYGEEVFIRWDDLLFSWSGNPKTSIDVFRYRLQDGWLNQHIFKVTANEEFVTKDFLYYVLKFLKPHFTQIAKNKQTTGLGHVTIADLKRMSLVIPSKEVQSQIVSILKAIDDKIEVNTSINKNLFQQASSIYQAWFEDFVLSDGSCPPIWKQGTLSDIADITSGKRPPVKSAKKTDTAVIPLVGAASVMGYTTEANHTNKILVTGRVGTHGVVQRFNSPCWTSDNTLVITSDLYEYTFQILQRIDYHAMNRGSTQPLITQGDMNKVSILIPDKETLSNFETLVGQLMEQYEANLLENCKLAELRDALLPRLMSGELDVSNIDL